MAVSNSKRYSIGNIRSKIKRILQESSRLGQEDVFLISKNGNGHEAKSKVERKNGGRGRKAKHGSSCGTMFVLFCKAKNN